MNPLKAFLVEDSPIVSDSLIAALEELAPIDVVGVVADERSAVQLDAGAGAATATS